MRDMISKAFSTWSKKDGVPIVDYSSQEKGKRTGSHTHSININDFRNFLKEITGFDCDIMCEIKDKEKSALKALRELNTLK
jgi:UV DNA damage endonuclease